MLKIENAYYNAKEIRRLGRTHRDNLIITYANGEVDYTDYCYRDEDFEQLIKKWEKEISKEN